MGICHRPPASPLTLSPLHFHFVASLFLTSPPLSSPLTITYSSFDPLTPLAPVPRPRAHLTLSFAECREYAEDESDIDDEWILQHEESLVVLEREKITKKFQKEQKKHEEEGTKPLPDSELKDRLKAADDLEKSLKSERKKGWKESKLSEAKLIAAISKMDDRIQVAKTNATDKDEGKEVSLGTSKINYIVRTITSLLRPCPPPPSRSSELTLPSSPRRTLELPSPGVNASTSPPISCSVAPW